MLVASLDISDLYLRKIKNIEFTYRSNSGWEKNRRNRFEFFYETDYLMDAGTNNPLLIEINHNDDEKPLAIADWGFFIDLTGPKNPLDLIFFNFNSKTMMVNPDHENFTLMTLALAFPELVSDEDTYIRQSITGLSMSFHNFFTLSYGVILDERGAYQKYHGFYEFNIPFFSNSFVRNLKEDKIDRYEGTLHYDRYHFKIGFRYKNLFSVRKHYYISSDLYQNGGFAVNGGVVTNGEFQLASGTLGVDYNTEFSKSKNHKYGSALKFHASTFLVNPKKVNIWGDQFGDDEFHPGMKAEFSLQAPLVTWLGFFTILFGTPLAVAAADGDAAGSIIETGTEMMSAGKESDSSFGIFTIGFDYNNPHLLQEIPNGFGHWHFYANFRIIY